MRDSKKTEKTNSNLKYWLEILGFIIVLLVSLKVLSYAMDPIRLNIPGAVADKDMDVASVHINTDIGSFTFQEISCGLKYV